MRRILSTVGPFLLVLLCGASAFGRTEASYPYRFDDVWSAALRLIRVEYGCTITDKDPDVGFFTFEWKDSGHTYPGSVELVRSVQNRQETIRAVVQIPAMPSYIEQMIVERLARKLLEDYGEPQRPAPAPAPAQPSEPNRPDAGPARPSTPTEGN